MKKQTIINIKISSVDKTLVVKGKEIIPSDHPDLSSSMIILLIAMLENDGKYVKSLRKQYNLPKWDNLRRPINALNEELEKAGVNLRIDAPTNKKKLSARDHEIYVFDVDGTVRYEFNWDNNESVRVVSDIEDASTTGKGTVFRLDQGGKVRDAINKKINDYVENLYPTIAYNGREYDDIEELYETVKENSDIANKDIVIIGGGAGAGKTSTLYKLGNLLLHENGYMPILVDGKNLNYVSLAAEIAVQNTTSYAPVLEPSALLETLVTRNNQNTWVVLFDDFNEIESSAAKKTVYKQVNHLLELKEDILIVLTTTVPGSAYEELSEVVANAGKMHVLNLGVPRLKGKKSGVKEFANKNPRFTTPRLLRYFKDKGLDKNLIYNKYDFYHHKYTQQIGEKKLAEDSILFKDYLPFFAFANRFEDEVPSSFFRIANKKAEEEYFELFDYFNVWDFRNEIISSGEVENFQAPQGWDIIRFRDVENMYFYASMFLIRIVKRYPDRRGLLLEEVRHLIQNTTWYANSDATALAHRRKLLSYAEILFYMIQDDQEIVLYPEEEIAVMDLGLNIGWETGYAVWPSLKAYIDRYLNDGTDKNVNIDDVKRLEMINATLNVMMYQYDGEPGRCEDVHEYFEILKGVIKKPRTMKTEKDFLSMRLLAMIEGNEGGLYVKKGQISKNKGKIEEAHSFYLEAERKYKAGLAIKKLIADSGIKKELKDRTTIKRSYINLGGVLYHIAKLHFENNNIDMASKCVDKGIRYYKDAEETSKHEKKSLWSEEPYMICLGKSRCYYLQYELAGKNRQKTANLLHESVLKTAEALSEKFRIGDELNSNLSPWELEGMRSEVHRFIEDYEGAFARVLKDYNDSGAVKDVYTMYNILNPFRAKIPSENK